MEIGSVKSLQPELKADVSSPMCVLGTVWEGTQYRKCQYDHSIIWGGGIVDKRERAARGIWESLLGAERGAETKGRERNRLQLPGLWEQSK